MTLKDIAALAGVSPMTVSNVINGKTSRVSAATREKVNSIIEQYGYVPNMNARSLSNHTSSNIIAIVITDHDGEINNSHMENPYLSTMVGIVERELRDNGYYTMICTAFGENDLGTLMKNWNIGGVIILYPIALERARNLIQSLNCPLAFIDLQEVLPDTITVTSDDKRGCYLSTKYLINLGHTRIAFASDHCHSIINHNRFQGYRQALAEASIPFDPSLVYVNTPDYQGGILAGKQIALDQKGITAVVTTADICAIGIMEGARLGGLRVPAELSVIGYDNLSVCNYTTPKLTSVSQQIDRKGTSAVRMLLEKIHTGRNPAPCHVHTDVEIVERQSVIPI